MKFGELISAVGAITDSASYGDSISSLVYDSRDSADVTSLFICIKGYTSDGHGYASAMYDRGVRHFVAEHELELPQDAAVAVCADTRKALALISAAFFGHPSEKLFTIALTGTKGKTSTSFMIRNILEASGKKTGVIGTTGIYYDGVAEESDNSTPESYIIQKHMRGMADAGYDAVVMEASSQGLKLDRTYGIDFDIGVFTNLSPDHIGGNEHADFAEYLSCKKKLFSQCRIGVFNADDVHFNEMADGCTCEKVTFGYSARCDYTAANPYFGSENGKLVTEYDISLRGEKHRIDIPLLGEVSVYNSLCAAAVASCCGCGFDSIAKGLSATAVRGRTEITDTSHGFAVVLDYAHNEVSTESVFKTLSHYRKGRIITVFGCGGNRSRLRRFSMGDIISRNSDITVVTSDNPRFEELDVIIADIMSGVKNPLGEVTVIKDRREAIYYALSKAKAGDIVLIAGKGNQDYEEVKGIKYHFDEREVVRDYFINASR